jgi:hypothetical protein
MVVCFPVAADIFKIIFFVIGDDQAHIPHGDFLQQTTGSLAF